jgi:hypothetical protein
MLFLASIAASRGATWASDPQPVAYDDEAQVFTTVQFDTGFWPSPTDPIAIRFYLTPTGGVTTHLEGTSRLEWPALAHHVEGLPGGSVEMETGLEIGAEVNLDLFGVFTGVVPLATRSVSFADEAEVTGLLLPEDPPVVLGDQVGSIAPLDYAVPVIPGVNLVVGVNLNPAVALEVAGTDVQTSVGDQELVQDAPDGWSPVDPDPQAPGELGMVTAWNGQLGATLSLVLEPHVDVDTPLGAFTLASFPIPVDLVDEAAKRTSTPVFAVHPLPVLAPPDQAHEFGAVVVGATGTWEVALENVGAMVLQGAVGIEGDGAFSVWPDGLAALPAGSDGLTVTFAPTTPGEHAAELWLETNDPWAPVVRIALHGTAPGDDVAGGEVDGDTQKFCGCGGSAPQSTAVILVALCVLRSRRH